MNVFVGCSAAIDIDYKYHIEAKKLAKYLASHNYTLITGASTGLVSTLQDTFNSFGMNVMIMEADCYKKDKYKYEVYAHNTIALRKYALICNSDLIIFLPGGFGTLDEIFTVIESKRALEHNKDIIIINSFGYYDDLIMMFNKIYSEKFALSSCKKLYTIFDDVDEAIKYIDGR